MTGVRQIEDRGFSPIMQRAGFDRKIGGIGTPLGILRQAERSGVMATVGNVPEKVAKGTQTHIYQAVHGLPLTDPETSQAASTESKLKLGIVRHGGELVVQMVTAPTPDPEVIRTAHLQALEPLVPQEGSRTVDQGVEQARELVSTAFGTGE
jgi:hypothetical protein